jgi:hypothetical protein
MALDIDLNDYDWRQVFAFAGDEAPDGCFQPCIGVSACFGANVSTAPVRWANVQTIIAAAEGERDGPDWLIVVQLTDGRFAFIQAGCDFTGWDSRASGSCIVDTDLPHLIRYGIGDGERKRLGLSWAETGGQP